MSLSDEQYLKNILQSQTLADDGIEMKELREQRDNVEQLLKEAFPAVTIRYGGSKIKGTLIKESYDLDLVCYFPYDETAAGTTLKDLYQNVSKTLTGQFMVEDKTSAVRLLSRTLEKVGTYTHVDVVPGRYTDATKSDCYLHQNGGSKERLKTNLDTHIEHIRDSGVVPALRLLKLWKVLNGMEIKQFAFELLGVELLKGKKGTSLADQLKHFSQTVSQSEEPISIQDPANPTGNDLMPLMKAAWPHLRLLASQTYQNIANDDWASIFGDVPADTSAVAEQLSAAIHVAREQQPTKPWSA